MWPRLKKLADGIRGIFPDAAHRRAPKMRLGQLLLATFRQFVQLDLRLSHLIILALILLGAAVNLLLPHGWTIWPFVLVASVMTVINEAADRTGQGVPPLYVYAFFVGAVALWFVATMAMSVVNPFVLLLGLLVLAYYCAQGFIAKREQAKLIAKRRSDGCCIHCGETINPKMAFCANCGEEPNPDMARLERVSNMAGVSPMKARTRESLTPVAPTAAVKQKEQALLARHRGNSRRG
jgi:hypothetical protein